MYLSAVDRWSQYLITELFPSETLDPKKLCVQQAWATEPPEAITWHIRLWLNSARCTNNNTVNRTKLVKQHICKGVINAASQVSVLFIFFFLYLIFTIYQQICTTIPHTVAVCAYVYVIVYLYQYAILDTHNEGRPGKASSRFGRDSKALNPETVSNAVSWDILNQVGLLPWRASSFAGNTAFPYLDLTEQTNRNVGNASWIVAGLFTRCRRYKHSKEWRGKKLKKIKIYSYCV